MAAGGHATGTEPVRPCGRGRQVLVEAAKMSGRDLMVHAAGATGDAIESRLLSTLIPDAFGPADLGLSPPDR